ncbi:MAG: hypothetical protein HYX80_09765 [Chloroflexi bacterium]|nr:hypothetical protein [Chloroflexota bacterium]
MTSKNEISEWQKLSWAEKLQICQSGEAQEDSLLHTYVTIFIAIEAMFFALVFGLALSLSWLVVITILAILVAIWFMHVFYQRGKGVDRWGALLYGLYKDASMNEFKDYYYGCFKREELMGTKHGWFLIIFGWSDGKWWSWFKSFTSARRVCVTYTPILVIIGWIVLILVKTLDC